MTEGDNVNLRVKFYQDGSEHTITQGHFEDNHWFILDAGEKCEVGNHCGGCSASHGNPLSEKTFCSYIHPADRIIENHRYDKFHEDVKPTKKEKPKKIKQPAMKKEPKRDAFSGATVNFPKAGVGSAAGLAYMEYAVWFIILLLALSCI